MVINTQQEREDMKPLPKVTFHSICLFTLDHEQGTSCIKGFEGKQPFLKLPGRVVIRCGSVRKEREGNGCGVDSQQCS